MTDALMVSVHSLRDRMSGHGASQRPGRSAVHKGAAGA